MKVYVSQSCLEWLESKRSEKKAIKAFERFFESVHNAKSVAEAPKPKKRDGGTAQGGNGGTVMAYEVARSYRLYANWVAPVDGADVAFYAAVAMSKSNEKSQGDDIGRAITMFKAFNEADWSLWKPSSESLNTPVEPKLDEVVDSSDKFAAESKSKKKKGKPVDENGLTAAERKALRKKEQEERQRQQKLAAEQKRRAAAENVASAQPQTPQSPVVADVTVVVPDTAPRPITEDVKFHDVMNVQYELELIEHQMKIERLQMEIIQQNIALAQRAIALEELSIKRLKLLQTQKLQDIQK